MNTNNNENTFESGGKYGKNVADNLNKLLETNNISGKVLAEQLHVGESTISKYRTNKLFPPVGFFIDLKELYKINIDDFIFKQLDSQDVSADAKFSSVEIAEKAAYKKYCGTYLLYYFNNSPYKGRDVADKSESIRFGILNVTEDNPDSDEPHCNVLGIIGFESRDEATEAKNKIDKIANYREINDFILCDQTLSDKLFRGDFEMSSDNAFISLARGKEKALIILNRVNRIKKEYIGGLGTFSCVSAGREQIPTIQYVALSRYPISISNEEIHQELLLNNPTYKADDNVKELIALFKKTYMENDNIALHNEKEKELIMKVNLEYYVKTSLTNNMFRYGKISDRDDGGWFDILEKTSIKNVN